MNETTISFLLFLIGGFSAISLIVYAVARGVFYIPDDDPEVLRQKESAVEQLWAGTVQDGPQ